MGNRAKLDAFYAKCSPEYFGVAGVAIIGICTLIAGITFIGKPLGESYSIFNHYVSELGTATPPLGWVFNLGLMIGVPAILFFLVGTRADLNSRLARISRGFGAVTGIGGFFVGVFPGNLATLVPHTIAASVFFLGGGLAVGLLSIALLRKADTRGTKFVGRAGLVVLGIFLAFPVVTVITAEGMTSFERIIAFVTTNRPPFAADAFFEWLTMFSVVGWVLLAALERFVRNHAPLS